MSDETKKDPSAWAKSKAFNALTKHPECLLDDMVLTDLIDEIAAAIDEARQFGEEHWRSRTMAIVHTAGGTVEGHPTSSINILQRVRELLAVEKGALS